MSLIDKLQDQSAIIGIIGLGYVGLPLALRFIEAGYQVIGFDVDVRKVNKLNSGISYIEHIPSDKLAHALAHGLEATSHYARASEADALIICVPTPLNEHHEPDLSFIHSTLDAILPQLRRNQIISLESTTYPGTTEEVLKPVIESRHLVIGQDIYLVYSPEREDPGNAKFSTRTIPKVCGGVTDACLEAGMALYSQVIDQVVPVSSTRVAEMAKLLENIHRAVNIGLVNELKMVADRMGIDIHEVITAAATKPFGFVPYYPGPGLGGHCIPIDPFYLTWKAKEYNLHTRFIELAGQINSEMPHWVVEKVVEGLNCQQRAVNGSKILILGVAYKKNVDDLRESPALLIMEELRKKGAEIAYHDPHVPQLPAAGGEDQGLCSVPLSAEDLGDYHCVVIVTDHDDVDYDLIGHRAQLIVDSRGVYIRPQPNMIKA